MFSNSSDSDLSSSYNIHH